MQTFTYEEIREKALKQGVTDNRLRVGLWASSNGYIKSKRKIQGMEARHFQGIFSEPLP